jgi:hypothetical protein
VKQSHKSLALLGFVIGFVFGAVDLLLTWLDPLADDTPGALLLFYGPMFLAWAIASFVAARRTGRASSGVLGGTTIALATACVFVAINLLRVNFFFDQLVNRADWQDMMLRFKTSGFDSLRLFVDFEYVRGTPFKIAVATAIGVLMGAVGGTLWWLSRSTRDPLAE